LFLPLTDTADAAQASTLSRTLQKDLSAEKSLTTGLLQKIKTLESTLSETTEREKAAQERVKEMEETVGDLMASISMGERVKENGGEGGDLGVVVTQKKKKGRR
jgi:BRCA1-associated protein